MTQAAEITAEPLTPRCAGVLRRAEHACVGISPFNSYFNEQCLVELSAWATARFERVCFFIPAAASAHTLEALGYPPHRARVKAHRQGRWLRNKLDRALAAIGVVDALVLDSAALADNR